MWKVICVAQGTEEICMQQIVSTSELPNKIKDIANLLIDIDILIFYLGERRDG